MTIPEGWEKFMSHCARPAIVRGVSPNTFKRYRAVKDKHLIFCQSGGIRDWKEVDKKSAYEYASYLQKEGYADRTIYLELNLLVGIVKWLIEEQILPASAQFQLKLSKPQGSETYCYTSEEVSAITSYCRSHRELAWIQNIIVTLANTGFRIGELISLRWEDIDLKANTIQLKDERATVKKKMLGIARTTKGKRGRSIPLHPVLRKTLITMGILRNGFVFQGPKEGTLKADVVRRAMIRDILEPLSSQFPQAPGVIGFGDGRLHSFRHYFVSDTHSKIKQREFFCRSGCAQSCPGIGIFLRWWWGR